MITPVQRLPALDVCIHPFCISDKNGPLKSWNWGNGHLGQKPFPGWPGSTSGPNPKSPIASKLHRSINAIQWVPMWEHRTAPPCQHSCTKTGTAGWSQLVQKTDNVDVREGLGGGISEQAGNGQAMGKPACVPAWEAGGLWIWPYSWILNPFPRPHGPNLGRKVSSDFFFFTYFIVFLHSVTDRDRELGVTRYIWLYTR